MCGRFALYTSRDEITKYFSIDYSVPFDPSFNIAPTQLSPVICQISSTERSLSLMRWGLIPSWASSIKAIKSPLINARADTIQARPSFKKAFQQRRCLVIANGFFEWSLEGTIKQPYFFQLTTKEPMAFAGVWEKWTNNEMSVDSFTIITGEPNPFISAYHDRMPIILRPENYSEWLSQDTELNAATELLVPYEAEIMMRFPVNPKMNSPRFNSPDCVTPIQFKDSY